MLLLYCLKQCLLHGMKVNISKRSLIPTEVLLLKILILLLLLLGVLFVITIQVFGN